VETEEVSAKAVRDVVKHIKKNYGDSAEKLAKAMLIAVDGESMNLRKGYATPFKGGESVQFLPICGGG
jgi:molybdopterin converting factor small subunit